MSTEDMRKLMEADTEMDAARVMKMVDTFDKTPSIELAAFYLNHVDWHIQAAGEATGMDSSYIYNLHNQLTNLAEELEDLL